MRLLWTLGLWVLSAGPACAQMAPMPGMAPATTPWAAQNQESMARMHAAMANSAGGQNEDQAFVRGMLPHHQGAIDMARTELQFGRDPTLRRLAQRIVAAQQQEIIEMRTWLIQHHGG